jgi:hypothetical protein
MRACVQRMLCIPGGARCKGRRKPIVGKDAGAEFTQREDGDDGESDSDGSLTSVTDDTLPSCPTCWRLMPRPSFCPTCRMCQKPGVATSNDISTPNLSELQVGKELHATIHGNGMGTVHSLSVTRLAMRTVSSANGSKHTLALFCRGIDKEFGKTPGEYFIPLDLDALTLAKRQSVPILINDTKLGVCTVLITDRLEHTPRSLSHALPNEP